MKNKQINELDTVNIWLSKYKNLPVSGDMELYKADILRYGILFTNEIIRVPGALDFFKKRFEDFITPIDLIIESIRSTLVGESRGRSLQYAALLINSSLQLLKENDVSNIFSNTQRIYDDDKLWRLIRDFGRPDKYTNIISESIEIVYLVNEYCTKENLDLDRLMNDTLNACYLEDTPFEDLILQIYASDYINKQ